MKKIFYSFMISALLASSSQTTAGTSAENFPTEREIVTAIVTTFCLGVGIGLVIAKLLINVNKREFDNILRSNSR